MVEAIEEKVELYPIVEQALLSVDREVFVSDIFKHLRNIVWINLRSVTWFRPNNWWCINFTIYNDT
jgi:hypothetical protein